MDLNRGDGQDGQASGPGSADRRGWSQGAQARPSLCLPDTPAAHASRSGPDREGGRVREARQAGRGEGPHGVPTQPEVLRSDQASSPDTEGPPLLRHCPCRLASGLTSAGPGGGHFGVRWSRAWASCVSPMSISSANKTKVSAEVAQAGTLACRAVPRHGCHTSARGWHCPAGQASGVERQADQETASALEHAAHAGGLPRLRSAPRPPWLGEAAAFPTAGVPAPQECRAGEGPRVRNADPACCSHAGP